MIVSNCSLVRSHFRSTDTRYVVRVIVTLAVCSVLLLCDTMMPSLTISPQAFNPAAEAQAAGRIHRLGQTRDVLITRFVFTDTIEENIVRMHAAIAAGQVQMQDGLVPPNGVRMLTEGQ